MKVEKLVEIIGSDFYTGVPDSQLKALCNYLMATYGIDPHHHVIAANPVALEKGFAPGCVCAKVGAPEIHRQCKLTRLFQTGEAQTDNVIEDRIRGWMPVEGYPDLSVHFAVMIPEE